ncbi:hypothetical protein KIL84_003700 [Mauremys mutica]|uniref:Uncharacterized protein n=1 Tax=Mauremys mutica TaxID=74926 RepID=A0A9D3WUA4_9SAUR|nr:hypothetical protein KIL84_003700 [Mauremys mutica]
MERSHTNVPAGPGGRIGAFPPPFCRLSPALLETGRERRGVCGMRCFQRTRAAGEVAQTVESCVCPPPHLLFGWGWADAFISPNYCCGRESIRGDVLDVKITLITLL